MASSTEIGVALKRLTNTLPPPRGIAMDKAIDGYVTALQAFGAEEIDEAIGRYLAAEFPDVSLKFYPRAPELAAIVRRVRAQKAGVADRPTQAKAPRAPLGETLFQRQWRRWKAGEIGHIGEGLHGAPVRQRQPDEDLRARYGMTEAALAGTEAPAEARQDEDFGGLA